MSTRLRLTCMTVLVVAASGPRAFGAGPEPGGPPIRLGHFGSMSGSLAAFGDSADKGIRLAAEEANRRGGVLGRRVEVVTVDDLSDTEQVLPSVLKLLDARDRKADVILGEISSTLTLIAAPLCQERGVPMVTPASTAAQITQKGDYIFRVCFTDAHQGRAGALFVGKSLKARDVALLVDQSNAYSLGFAREFRKLFEAQGGRIVAEMSYQARDKDFKPQLTSIAEAGPEVLVIPAMYGDVPGIARQAKALGIAIPLVGGDGWDADETAKIGGKDVEGDFFMTHYAPDQPSSAVKGFVDAYRRVFNAPPPDSNAALGYDAARIAIDAVERAGTTDHRAVRDALAATKGFPGVTGTITMGADRNPVKSVMVLQIRDGSYHLYETIEPEAIEKAVGSGAARRGAAFRLPTARFLLQQLVNGISLGAVYGLIAVGYTIVYGILRLINFAHGDVFMLGPVLVVMATAAGLNIAGLPGGAIIPALAVFATAMGLCGLAGFGLERLAYRPLRIPYSWTTIAILTLALPAALLAVGGLLPGFRAGLSLSLRLSAVGSFLYGLALACNRLASLKGLGPPDRSVPLITAIGASIFLEYSTQQDVLFGKRPRKFPVELVSGVLSGPSSGSGPFHVGGLLFDRADVLVLVVTLALVGALTILVRRSRMGMAMRAVSGNPDAAVLMGVNIHQVVSFSFTLGGVLAGAAGVLWAVKYPTIDPLMGLMPGLKAFVAAVLGGIGSLPGALLGGLLMGVCETIVAASPASEYKDALAFVVLIAVLLVRPAGLLGRNLPEKV